MINVLISGCNGKMGNEVINQITKFPDMVLSCGFDVSNNKLNSFPTYTKTENIVSTVDVIVDFSAPSLTLNILEFAVKNNIPIVIATTGFSNKEEEIIIKGSETIPIFQSSNMSFNISLMSKIVGKLASILKDTDIEIIETHHSYKKDAPSGTALLLANSINKNLGNTMNYTFDRHSLKEKRNKNEIGFSSIRGGNIVGEHTVKFFSENETFEITHTSYSRSIYAEGALKATKFLINKPVGLYNMDDLVKEKGNHF